jgi:uncharacterized protein (DUF362 family)
MFFHIKGVKSIMSTVVEFETYEKSVQEALERSGFASKVKEASKIIIKPNIIEDVPPPLTTDVRCIEAIIRYIQERFEAKHIVIAEGSGGCQTSKAYKKLGYTELAEKYKVELIDLDAHKTIKEVKVEHSLQWGTIYLPELVIEGFLVSAAVLKHHTITHVTLSLKNMIGILPKKHYSGYWSYNKSMVHKGDVEKAIHDIHRVRRADFAVIDAAIGQFGSHLTDGRPFDPPIGKIIACSDPVQADEAGCRLLNEDPEDIEHIQYCKKIYCHRDRDTDTEFF